MGLPCLPLPGGTDTRVGVDTPVPSALRSGRHTRPTGHTLFYLLIGDTLALGEPCNVQLELNPLW